MQASPRGDGVGQQCAGDVERVGGNGRGLDRSIQEDIAIQRVDSPGIQAAVDGDVAVGLGQSLGIPGLIALGIAADHQAASRLEGSVHPDPAGVDVQRMALGLVAHQSIAANEKCTRPQARAAG